MKRWILFLCILAGAARAQWPTVYMSNLVVYGMFRLGDTETNAWPYVLIDTNVTAYTDRDEVFEGSVEAESFIGDGSGITNLQAANIAAGGILPALDGSGLTNLSLGATGIVAGATDTFDLTTRTLTWNTNKSAKGEAFSVGILADLSNDVSSAWASSTNNYYVPLAEAYTNIGGTVTVQAAWGLAREIYMTNAFAFNHAFSTNESCVVELQIHGGGAFEPSWDTNYFSSTTTNLTINTNDWNTLMLHKVRAKPTIDVFRLVVE